MMFYKNDVEKCLTVLQNGGIILYPTDTVWGIGCDATNENAVAKIYALKNRIESKSMIILMAEEAEILHYTSPQTNQVFDYLKGIHKPVTVIYPNAKNLAKNIINTDGTVAIRIVKDEFCKELINSFGKPIVSTSANVSGYPTPGLFSDIDVLIKSGVDYVVHYRQDDDEPKSPSTIIKIKDDGNIEIIRP
jgi:L-threonylcarbamoyladenylate synthase